MNFWQRAFNTVTTVFAVYFHRRSVLPVNEDVAAKTMDINNFTSIANITGHWSGWVAPQLSQIQELLSFLDDCGDAGFIVVSFGSMLRGDDVPDNFCRHLHDCRSALSQQELLAHPRVRLVISHGDLLSKQEAVYHGVPAIFLPISSDQPINAQKRKRLHYSYKLGWVDRGGFLQRHSTHFEHLKVWNACIISIVSPAYMSPCILNRIRCTSSRWGTSFARRFSRLFSSSTSTCWRLLAFIGYLSIYGLRDLSFVPYLHFYLIWSRI